MDTQAHDKFTDRLSPEELDLLARVLRARPEELALVSALKKGMTNRSFLIDCRGEKYIFRVPGAGTGRLISRREEADAYRAVQGRELCEDVLYLDPDSGYKLSRYIEGARVCDPLSPEDTAACMKKLRAFHRLGLKVGHEFDIFGHIDFYEGLWEGRPSAYPDYQNTKEKVFRLKPFLDAQAGEKVLTHIDAVPDNFLFYQNEGGQREIRLIDWEYAGMQDPHVDIAMFCIYAMYDREQVDRLIGQYFTEGCPAETRVKVYCYIAACGLLWSNWCEYKHSLGIQFGAYSLRQYQYAVDYYRIAVEEMEKMGGAPPCTP